MPQPTNLCNKSKKKVAASNGRIPAYNNTFAFRHNPKSKKTASILASPIQYCCRRCHDKLVWRKTYRKYKPLTQPTSCNLCNKRNITAAYHTVCDSCSVSHPKAIAQLQEWNNRKNNKNTGKTSVDAATSADSGNEQVDALTTAFEKNMTTEADEPIQTEQNEEEKVEDVTGNDSLPPTTTSTRRNYLVHKRVCTVCFKQPALPDDDTNHGEDDDDDEEGDINNNNRPLKLRQMKSLQRQREKQQQEQDEKGQKKKAPITDAAVEDNRTGIEEDDEDEDEEDDEQYDEDEAESGDDAYHHGTTGGLAPNDDLDHIIRSTTTKTAGTILDIHQDDDDMDDPFLQAIGGAQNLLVGDAYQKKLLEQKTLRFE